MCQADENHLLDAFGVARKELTPQAMTEQLRAHGAGPELIDSLVESEALETMVGLCEAFRDPLINALRQERFGALFGRAMRSSPQEFLDVSVDAMLPLFDHTVTQGSTEREDISRQLGQILAALEFDSEQSLELDGVESDSALAMAPAPTLAMLDFLPRPAHAQIIAVQQRFLLKAQAEGPVVFRPDYEDSAEITGSPKTL